MITNATVSRTRNQLRKTTRRASASDDLRKPTSSLVKLLASVSEVSRKVTSSRVGVVCGLREPPAHLHHGPVIRGAWLEGDHLRVGKGRQVPRSLKRTLTLGQLLVIETARVVRAVRVPQAQAGGPGPFEDLRIRASSADSRNGDETPAASTPGATRPTSRSGS